MKGENALSGQCDGGPGTWTLHVLALPSKLNGPLPKALVQHFFTRDEALAARAAWKKMLAGNAEALTSVTPWQPSNAATITKLYRRALT